MVKGHKLSVIKWVSSGISTTARWLPLMILYFTLETGPESGSLITHTQKVTIWGDGCGNYLDCMRLYIRSSHCIPYIIITYNLKYINETWMLRNREELDSSEERAPSRWVAPSSLGGTGHCWGRMGWRDSPDPGGAGSTARLSPMGPCLALGGECVGVKRQSEKNVLFLLSCRSRRSRQWTSGHLD